MSRAAWHKHLTTEVNNAPIQQHLSVRLISQTIEDGIPTARCEFISTPHHLVSSGTVHGGISSLVIDSACFLAVIPTLDPGQGTATIASSFQILGSIPGVGKRYEIVARIVKRGKNVVFCEGEVVCEGRLIAKGNLTKMVTEGKKGEQSKL
jgi:acyl-coenzyme A thioesterase PaaI-like protein